MSTTGFPLACRKPFSKYALRLASMDKRLDRSPKNTIVPMAMTTINSKIHIRKGAITFVTGLSIFFFNEIRCSPDAVHGDNFCRIKPDFKMFFQ